MNHEPILNMYTLYERDYDIYRPYPDSLIPRGLDTVLLELLAGIGQQTLWCSHHGIIKTTDILPKHKNKEILNDHIIGLHYNLDPIK